MFLTVMQLFVRCVLVVFTMSIIRSVTSYGYELYCELADAHYRWEKYSHAGYLMQTETQNGDLVKTIFSNGRTIVRMHGCKIREYHGDRPVDILRARLQGYPLTPREQYDCVMEQLSVVARNQRSDER